MMTPYKTSDTIQMKRTQNWAESLSRHELEDIVPVEKSSESLLSSSPPIYERPQLYGP